MDFEELKERYKMLPLWARFLIAGIIGLLPGAYIYYDEGDALQAQLDEVGSKESEAREKFEQSRQQKANLPKLEEEMAFTEEQLLKAKKKLPDTYRIEEILQTAATIAKEVGVKLVIFDPLDEIQHPDGYKYVELPIKTEIQGRFGQIASFFDRIVHLETSIFVRRLEIARVPLQNLTAALATAPAKTEFQIARESRQNLRLTATFELVVFRGMSKEEAEARPLGENGEEIPEKFRDEADKAAQEGAMPAAPPEKAGDSARTLPARPKDVTTF